MKKLLAAIVIIALLAIVLVPFFNGIAMEKIIRKNFQDVNDLYADTGSGVTIQVVEYDRHFRSSDIVWKVTLDHMKELYGIDAIVFSDHAEHGITGVVSTTSLEKNEWFQMLLQNILNGRNPLTITTKYSLTGTTESVITIDEFSTEIEGAKVTVKPGTFTFSSSSGFEKIDSTGTWAGAIVDQRLTIQDFSFDSAMEKITTFIWAGKMEYRVEDILINDGEESFEAKKIKGNYYLDYHKKTDSLSTGIAFAVDLAKDTEFSVEDALVDLTINNLNAQGYEELFQKYTEFANSAFDNLLNETASADFDEQMAAVGMQLLPAAEKLMKKGLELEISDLKATLPVGEVAGSLKLQLNQDMTFAQALPIAEQPDLAFELLNLESQLRLPRELVGENGPMLTQPLFPGMETGFFIVDGSYLSHEAKTKDGKLIMNGRNVSFQL